MVSQLEHSDVLPWQPQHCIGGHPALDLVNTISHRRDPAIAIDRMDGAEKIAQWFAYQGFLSADEARDLVRLCQTPGAEAAFVSSVDRLRGAAAEIFDNLAIGNGPPPGAFAHVLATSSNTRIALEEVPDDSRQPAQYSLHGINTDIVVATIALSVLDAVFRLPRTRIRSCPRCGWLFFDRSKAARRRWCSMKACGNREKVSRHYRSKRD